MAIVTEALSNAIRHAQAQNVTISAKDLGKKIQVIIMDDGVGVPQEPKVGYGLRNMRDRTRILNGAIEFKNKQGTSISITIPWIDE